MITEDYIMRQVAMLSQVLARMFGMRDAGQHEAALAEADNALYHLLGMSGALVAALPPDDLVAMLRRDATKAAGQERCALLAAFLLEQAVNLEALQRHAEGRVIRRKALQVVVMVTAEADGAPVPEHLPRLEPVAADLEPSELPRTMYPLWLAALEREGAYAKVEDLLFEMLAAELGDAELFAWGEAFYARLERKSDAELAAGNLPRHEIDHSRTALRQRGRTG